MTPRNPHGWRRVTAHKAGSPWTPWYDTDPHVAARRHLYDHRHRPLGYVDRLAGGLARGYRVRTPRGRDIGLTVSISWAAVLLEQHRATGRVQDTTRADLATC